MPSHDVVIIGGGPAGATCGALLAQQGRKVLILERSKFPRFHIGESLMPESYWVFKRLGMLPKLRNSPFVKKYSVQFVNATGKESQPFYFDEMNPHECSQTWQVTRAEFDKMMLDNAREAGCEVWEEANVTDIHLEPSDTDDLPRATGVTVCVPRLLPSPGTPGEGQVGGSPSTSQTLDVTARIIIDATGTAALLSRKLGIRTGEPRLRKASIFAHYKGGLRDEGKNEGATLVLSLPNQDGWFWYIPLQDDIVSVGVVADPEYLFNNRGKPPEVLDQEIAKTSSMARRLTTATRISPVHVLSDFTYRSTRVAGDGWVLIGDAFGFLDPIYSSGVFMALKTAELAADSINSAFATGDFSPLHLANWGSTLIDGYNAIRKLVYAFYTRGFSFGQFMRKHPEFKKNLVDLLIGDVFRPEVNDIFRPMAQMIELPEPIGLSVPASA
jgi:flavin-dependent dehydrogenase